MHKLENKTQKRVRDFEIQMNHSIRAKRPDLVLVNEKKTSFELLDFAVPVFINT